MEDDSSDAVGPNDITSQDVAFSLWMVPILDCLVDLDSFHEFCDARSVQKDNYDRLALGYGFAACLALQRLIQALLDRPVLFGAPYDEAVERAFQSDTSFSDMPSSSVQGKMVLRVASFYRPLLAVRNTGQLRIALDSIKEDLIPALHQVAGRFVVSKAYSKHFENSSAALRHTAIVGLHLFYQDLKMARIAYDSTFGRNKDPWAHPHVMPEVVDKRQRLFVGYKLAVAYLWNSLLVGGSDAYSSITAMKQTSSWKEFDSCYRKIQAQIIDPIEKEVDIFGGTAVFVAKAGVDAGAPPPLLLQEVDSAEGEALDERRLDRVFLGYPVRVVDHDLTASNTAGFVVALSGTAAESKEKVRVRKFVHGHHFSYAVLIPSSSNIADYSTWWLFYDFCSDDSGMGSAGYRKVEDSIRQLGDRVELELCEIGNLSLRDYSESHSEFAQYEAEEPDFDYNDLRSVMGRKYSPSFRKRLESAKHTIDGLRGSILELIVCSMLAQDGYSVRWGFVNSTILGDSEIDVLAIRKQPAGTEVLIVECTTSFDNKLLPEVEEKIAKISNSLPVVAKHLGWAIDVETCSVKGLVVTTSSKRGAEITAPKDIGILFRTDFGNTCQSHGIDRSEVERLFPDRYVPEFEEMSTSDLRDLLHREDEE